MKGQDLGWLIYSKSETSALSGNADILSSIMLVAPMVASRKLLESGLCVCVNRKS